MRFAPGRLSCRHPATHAITANGSPPNTANSIGRNTRSPAPIAMAMSRLTHHGERSSTANSEFSCISHFMVRILRSGSDPDLFRLPVERLDIEEGLLLVEKREAVDLAHAAVRVDQV